MNDALKTKKMIENGWIAVPIGLQEPLRLAVGPLVSQGIINSRRYEISCRYPPRGIPIDHILDTLRSIAKVKEVVLGNVKVGNRSVPVSKGGFTVYAEFPTTDEALNFPLEIEVDGDLVKLFHRGRFECDTCGEKGHSADYHDQIVTAKKRDVRKKKLYRERKKAKAEARRKAQ